MVYYAFQYSHLAGIELFIWVFIWSEIATKLSGRPCYMAFLGATCHWLSHNAAAEFSCSSGLFLFLYLRGIQKTLAAIPPPWGALC